MTRSEPSYHGARIVGCVLLMTLASHRSIAEELAGRGAASAPSPQASENLEIRAALALDRPIDLRVDDLPLPHALRRLAELAEVPIDLAPGATTFLPYGWQTRVSATIRQRTLREALTAITAPLGFTFKPTPQGLILQPSPPLQRLRRRPTWDDLDTLHTLVSHPFSIELFDALQIQFQDIPAPDSEANRNALRRRALAVGDGSAAEVLEQACREQGWTWYPNGQKIVVLPQTRQIERQLETRISLRYTQANLVEALTDLADRAGILIRFDPGVLAALPPQTTERFSLSIENATIRQALEVIAGETGLSYVIEPEGLRITGPSRSSLAAGPSTAAAQVEATARAAVAAIRSNAIVGQITFPMPDGSSYSFFIRQNDLPPDVDTMRKAKIAETINHIRRRLHDEQPQD